MQVAIVGLPGSGKTTVFTALGGHPTESGHAAGRAAPNVGVVPVPDERVDALAAVFHPRKTVYADVTYVDLAIPAGATRAGTVDPDLLGRIRNSDALLVVARAFDSPSADRPPDPWVEVDDLDLEYVVADFDVVTRRLERLRTAGRHGTPAEREQNAREEALLDRLAPELEEGRPLRDLAWSEDDERLARGFRFLSQKPQLVVLNIAEERLAQAADLEAEAQREHARPQRDVIVLAGRIEAEIAALPEADARLFLDDLGIAEPSRGRVIRRTYGLLGLFSFLTSGPDECRAWTVPIGATALDAAAAIHSDLARGFIRAEVVDWQDLVACGSTAEARRRGVLRSEGKAYRVRDGDVIEILFNVGR
jgi:GTP-binding protein YchF